jgi:anti-sigma-K factor RskA
VLFKSAGHPMSSLDRKERELVFDYCLGLICAEEAAKVEAWIAGNEQAAAFHARIQAALGLLESLPSESCPPELADNTVRCLCARAREAQTSARSPTPRVRSHDLEDFWLCLSNNILMTSSS